MPRLLRKRIREDVQKNVEAESVPQGRPSAIPVEQNGAVCNEICELERKGRSLGEAKRVVAKRYGVATRTVRRIWNRRAEYPEAAVSVAEVEGFVDSLFQN